jgi:soluble lytic murein transglycosylase-like protein
MWLRLTRGLLAALALCLAASAYAQELKLDSGAVFRARTYEPGLIEAAARYGVDARLLWVIAYLETRFNPNLVSRKGARGLMQLMPATATRFGATDPHDPIKAIDAAARYVRHLMERFDGNADLTLAAYNAGEVVVETYLTGQSIQVGSKVINPARRITGGIPPYPETRGYVTAGLNILKKFESFGEIELSQRQTKKDTKEEDASSSPPKSKSIFYVAPLDQAASPRAKPNLRLSITVITVE